MQSPDKITAEITERLVRHFAPERIFLFGSHVWGNPDQNSDLDLLMIVEHSEHSPAKRASLAYRCLRDIPYPIDILVKTREEVERCADIPAALEHKILAQGRLLYGQ
jgi:predicted nucleotidyltransferase